jgi:hypothetical protein
LQAEEEEAGRWVPGVNGLLQAWEQVETCHLQESLSEVFLRAEVAEHSSGHVHD